jgi:hypothetical protein
MAQVFQVKGRDATVTMAYCVSAPVGPGCTNRRDDVLLVQHLLRLAWRTTPTAAGFRPPGETEPLKTDGMFGPKTGKFISFFQEEAVRHGAKVKQDGRVDPVITGASMSGGNTFYTVLAMNSARNSRDATQADISTDPEYPTELSKSFFVAW